MSSVDNRIVNMRFDNQQFERNVRTSVKTLDNLKKSLNLDGAAKSLDKLDTVGKKFSLAGMASAVDTIAARFTNLGIVATTVIQNITNRAIDAGTRIASAMTIDPLKQGFDEYEIKMNSIQTLLSNTSDKGTTLDDVNKGLAELNEYADKTIYNFAQMTDNAAKFAAAGVDFDSSIMNVQGMANVAAGFGVSAEKMAGATYQMTQALGSGRVIWEDWKSLQQAGMGGVKLQNEMTAMADKMGIVRDKSKSFKDSLESGWLTAEVFTKVMGKMAKDPALLEAATNVTTFTKMLDTMREAMASGWAQSWENILGGSEQSKAVWTSLSNAFAEIVGGAADARNAMLRFWADNGGRKDLILGIVNALTAIGKVIEPIEKAFRSIFPATTAQQLMDMSRSFKELMDRFKIGEDTANNLHRTFKGFFAIVSIGAQVVSAIGRSIANLIQYLLPVGSGFLSITGSVGDYLVAIDAALKTSDSFNKGLEKIGNIIKPIGDAIKLVASKIFEMTSSFSLFGNEINSLENPFKQMLSFFGNIAEKVSTSIKNIVNNIVTGLSDGNSSSLLGVLNTGVLATILLGIKNFVNGLKDNLSGGSLANKIGELFDKVSSSLGNLQGVLRANVLLQIGIAIGVLAASLALIASIEPKQLEVALGAITIMFMELFGSMMLFEKLMGAAGFLSLGKIVVSMVVLSSAVLLLSFAVTRLSKLDWSGLIKGLGGVAGLMGIMVGTSKLMDGAASSFIRSAIGLVILGGAVLVLSNALIKMGALDLATLGKGLLGVGVIMTELALFMKVTNLSGMGLTKSAGIVALSTAILILSHAVSIFAALDQNALLRGLGAVGALLTGLGLFVRLTGSTTGLISTSVGLVVMASSMLIFSKAIGSMGNLSLETIGKGLLSMAGALTIIGLAIKLIPGNGILLGLGLVVISGALLMMSNALTTMGNMSLETIGRSMLVLAGSLLLMTTAISFMQASIGGLFALFMMADALDILAPILVQLGNMSLASIGTALLALAGTFAVFGIAGALAAPLTPILLGLSSALFVFSLSLLGISGSMFIFAVSLASIVATMTAGGLSIGLFMTTVSALIALIPFLFENLAKGFIAGIKVIGEGTPTIIESLKKILTGIGSLIPSLILIVGELIVSIIKTIDKLIPDVVNVIVDFLIAIVVAIDNNMGIITQAGIDLVISFIESVADGLDKNTDKAIVAIEHLISSLVTSGKKALMALLPSITNIGRDIGTGLINGVKGMYNKVFGSGEDMGDAVKDGLKTSLDSHSPSEETKKEGENAADGVVAGVKKKAGGVADFFFKMGENLTNSLAAGTKKETPAAVSAATKMGTQTGKAAGKAAKTAFELSMDWIEERKYYTQLTLQEELAAYERMLKRYKDGTDEHKKLDREIYRVKNEMEKTAYQKSMDWMDDKKYYNDLTLQQELDAIERVLARHGEATDEHKKLDREAYRVKKEQIEQLADLREKENARSFDWIENEKFYGRLNPKTEKESYQRIIDRISKVAKPTETEIDDLKKAKKEIFTIDKEIKEANDEYIKDLGRIQEESNDRRIELEKEYYDKTKEINKKLKDDISSLAKAYDDALESRTSAIYNSYGLFDKVDKQGVTNGKALMTNLKNQIAELGRWRETLGSLSSKGVDPELIKELSQMGPQSLYQIQALNKLSGPELDQYVKLWQQKYHDAKVQATGELVDMKKETITKTEELTNATKKELEAYDIVWNEKFTKLVTETNTQLTTLETNWLTKIGSVRTGTEKEISTLTDNIKSIIKAPNWSALAGSIMDPISSGIKTKAVTMAQDVANAVLGALKAADDVLGKGKTTPIQDALKKSSDLLTNNTGQTPTIRPVLTLTDVQNNAQAALARANGLTTSKTTSLVNTIFDPNNAINKARGSTQQAQQEQNPTWNAFNISSLTVREEADVKKVARELYQLQVAGSRG
jgi:tape measure domain-containing protein